MQQGAIHRKQRCCKKHVPTVHSVHDAEHVLECSKPNSDWFKRIRKGDGLWSGSSESAQEQRSSEAARCRAGSMYRVTRSGAERSNAAVPQGLCGQREVFKGLVKIPSLKYQVVYSTLASCFQPVCQSRCNAVSGVQGDGIGGRSS